MKVSVLSLSRDTRAASAAEFALVLPLLLLFLFGMLDVGRLMWTWNRAEKATQTGVRYAVATDLVAGNPTSTNNLYRFSFASTGNAQQGDSVDTSVFDNITCTYSLCTCAGDVCSDIDYTVNTAAFDLLYNRMYNIFKDSDFEKEDIIVTYKHVNLGYAGDPNGPDVAPLVTVSFAPNSITFQPLTLILFNASITLPSFSAALTMEDGSGNVSN